MSMRYLEQETRSVCPQDGQLGITVVRGRCGAMKWEEGTLVDTRHYMQCGMGLPKVRQQHLAASVHSERSTHLLHIRSIRL